MGLDHFHELFNLNSFFDFFLLLRGNSLSCCCWGVLSFTLPTQCLGGGDGCGYDVM
jgi:hypothetical protein